MDEPEMLAFHLELMQLLRWRQHPHKNSFWTFKEKRIKAQIAGLRAESRTHRIPTTTPQEVKDEYLRTA